MITEAELVNMIEALEAEALRRWVGLGWIAPTASAAGVVFDETDVARVRLICELIYDLDVGEETMPVVLSLLDQLHDARRMLRAFALALAEQSEDVRRKVAARARETLGAKG